MNPVTAALAAALAIVALVTCAEAAPVASRLLLGRPTGDAAPAAADCSQPCSWRSHLVPASGEPGSRGAWRVMSDHENELAASAQAQSGDAASDPSQPARSRRPPIAEGQSAQQRGHARPGQRALLDWTQRPVKRRKPAHSHSPAARRRPAQPSPATSAVARRRRAALSRAQALRRLRQRLQQRRRPPPPPVQRKAARKQVHQPAVPPKSGSPRFSRSRKQPRSKQRPARKPARKPARRPTRRPGKPAVKATVSLNGNGSAASGAARPHVTTAPLVQQHSPSAKVHRLASRLLAPLTSVHWLAAITKLTGPGRHDRSWLCVLMILSLGSREARRPRSSRLWSSARSAAPPTAAPSPPSASRSLPAGRRPRHPRIPSQTAA